MFRKDLHVELACAGGRAFDGAARAPRWSEAPQPAEGRALAVTGTPASGAISGTLAVLLRSTSLLEGDSASLVATLELKGTVSGGRASGDFAGRVGGSSVRGSFTGTAADLAAPAPPVPAPRLDTLTPHDQYAVAVGCEVVAVRLYRQARAAALVRSAGLAWPAALAQAPLLAPERPALVPKAARPLKPRRPSLPPTVPDIGDGLGLGGPTEPPHVAADAPRKGAVSTSATDPHAARRLAACADIRRSLGRMLAATRAQLDAADAKPAFQSGSAEMGDPLFGPYFGSDGLPRSRERANLLTAAAGQDGPQDWAYVTRWRTVGPVPRGRWSLHTPLLPDCFDVADANVALGPAWSGAASDARPPAVEARWEDADDPNDVGQVVPPQSGTPDSAVYAATTIQAEADKQLWCAVGATGAVKLWINDRLVLAAGGQAASQTGGPRASRRGLAEQAWLFRGVFRKGRNTVLLRCDTEAGPMGFWLRACIRGHPGEPAKSRQRLAAIAERTRQVRHLATGVRQFRRDATNFYPDATPVTAWDVARGINVLWRAAMEATSKSAPLVVGDMVFTQADPHLLICLDKYTGKVLWKRASDVLELLDRQHFAECERLHGEWTKLHGDARKSGDPNDPARVRAARDAARKRSEWMGLLTRYGGVPRSSPWDGAPHGPWVGYSFPSPITDGRCIWTHYGTGVTACYGLDGQRKWMVRTAVPVGGNHGMVPSPVLTGDPAGAAGRLVVQVALRDRKDAGGSAYAFIAYDPATGRQLWTAPVSVPGGTPSPVAMRLTDGREEMDVVVSDGGTVVRADDGKVLLRNMPGSGGNGTATPVGNVIYRFGVKYGVGTAMELLMLDRDTVGARRLWTSTHGPCAGGWAHCDGLFYALRGSQFGGPYEIVRRDDGTQVQRRVNVGVRGVGCWAGIGRVDAYVPTAATSDYVFLAVRGDRNRIDPWAHVTVVQTGEQGRYVAHNLLEPYLTAPPVFDADRTYWRSDGHLTCLAYTGEQGRAYEAEQNARLLLEDIAADEPASAEAPAARALAPARGTRLTFTGSIVTQAAWCTLAGPFPPAAADEAFAAFGGPGGAALGEAAAITAGGVTRRCAAFTKAQRGEMELTVSGRPGIDVREAAGGADGVWLFGFVVAAERKQTVRLHNKAPGAEVFVGGVKVGDQGRVTLVPGTYAVVARVRIDERTKAGEALTFRFTESDDVAAERQAWLADIRRNAEIFRRAVKYCPGTALAARAEAMLKHLGP